MPLPVVIQCLVLMPIQMLMQLTGCNAASSVIVAPDINAGTDVNAAFSIKVVLLCCLVLMQVLMLTQCEWCSCS